MKKLLAVLFASALIFCSAIPAFAADTAEPEIVMEELIETVEADDEMYTEADLPAEEELAAEQTTVPDASQIGKRGSMRTLIFSGCLVAFGGVTIMLANKRSKGKS